MASKAPATEQFDRKGSLMTGTLPHRSRIVELGRSLPTGVAEVELLRADSLLGAVIHSRPL